MSEDTKVCDYSHVPPDHTEILTCCICGRNIRRYPSDCGGDLDIWAAYFDGRSWCGPCLASEHAKRKVARKAQLDAMPRCEVPGCKARGAYRLADQRLLCGKHKRKAEGKTTAGTP